MCQNDSMKLCDFNPRSFLHLVQCIFLMYSAFVILLKQIAVLDHVHTTIATTTTTFTTTCTSWQQGSYLNDLSSAVITFLYECPGGKSFNLVYAKINQNAGLFWGKLYPNLCSGYLVLMFCAVECSNQGHFFPHKILAPFWPHIGARCASVCSRFIMQRDFSRLHLGCFTHSLPLKE